MFRHFISNIVGKTIAIKTINHKKLIGLITNQNLTEVDKKTSKNLKFDSYSKNNKIKKYNLHVSVNRHN